MKISIYLKLLYILQMDPNWKYGSNVETYDMMPHTHTHTKCEKVYYSHNEASVGIKAGFPSWPDNGWREEVREQEWLECLLWLWGKARWKFTKGGALGLSHQLFQIRSKRKREEGHLEAVSPQTHQEIDSDAITTHKVKNLKKTQAE